MTSDTQFPFGPDPLRASSGDGGSGIDDLVATYGRILFDLAYRLTGDPREAEDLSHEILVQCCLAADHVEGRSGAVASLYRDLLLLWRGRARRRRLREALLGGAPGGRAPVPDTTGRRPPEHLQPRLMRLDPDSRAVLVLRVGEGLDYEEIASVLGIPLEAVRSRLALARRRVRRRERFEGALEEMMNLYLDGRLKRPAREEFERRVGSDVALREAIEFHRGLTLEFREEAPSFPRDFLAQARALVEHHRAARGSDTSAATSPERPGPPTRPATAWWRRALIVEILVGVAAGVMIAAVLYPGLLRAPETTAPAGPAGGGHGDADRETVEELRSLGYLAAGGSAPGASGKPTSKRPAALRTPTPAGSTKKRAIETRAKAAETPPGRPGAADAAPAGRAPEAGGSRAAAEPSPAPPAGPASATPVESPTPPPAEPSPPAPAPLSFRAIPLPKGPDPGRDHRVIRSPEEWTAFAAGLDLAAPVTEFDRQMLVVLRDDLGTDPPSRLIVVSVTMLGDGLEVRCRVEPVEPAGASGSAAAPGMALIVPATDLPVRIVMM